jgi:S-formylglutathione hydrolase FrmB
MAVIKMNFLSKALGMQLNISVIIPSYSFADVMGEEPREIWTPGMKFQTMWLLHGFSGDDSDYINFSNIVRFADENKLAVVMPPAFNAGYTDIPDGAKYMSFVADEVFDMCRAVFPLSLKREDNILAGLSMGGAGAMKIGIARPEQYAQVLCMSGASRDLNAPMGGRGTAPASDPKTYARGGRSGADMSPGGPNDVFYGAERNVAEKKPLPKFLLTCGDKDFALENMKEARDRLRNLGYDVFWEEVAGYGHEWDFWDLTLRKACDAWFGLGKKAIYPA